MPTMPVLRTDPCVPPVPCPAYAAVVERCDECGFEYGLGLAPDAGRLIGDGVGELAFLHHRATVGDYPALTLGARHLYDAAMLLTGDRVRAALADGRIVELMVDIDERSEAAGWPFTPRPEGGFADSPAFGDNPSVSDALREGYTRVGELVWARLPSFDDAIEIVRDNRSLI